MELILKPKPSKWLILIVLFMLLTAIGGVWMSSYLPGSFRIVVIVTLILLGLRFFNRYPYRSLVYRYQPQQFRFIDPSGNKRKIKSIRLGGRWVSVCLEGGECLFWMGDQFSQKMFSDLKRNLRIHRSED
jgi:hypothetical protein